MSVCCKCNPNSRVMWVKDLHGLIPENAKIDEFICDKCKNKVEKYRCEILWGNGTTSPCVYTTTGIKNNNGDYEYYQVFE